MDERTIGIFVALAPALATALVGYFSAVLPAVRLSFDRWSNDLDMLDWMADLAFEFAFIGSAVVGYVFSALEAWNNLVFTFLWFCAWLYFNRMLLRRKRDLELLQAAETAKTQRNKLAGMIRSIVRSEMERHAATAQGEAVLTTDGQAL